MPVDRIDELRSVQYYMSLSFNGADDEIRIEKPEEGEEYRFLIEDVTEESDPQGTYMSNEMIVLNVNAWLDTRTEAIAVKEQMRDLFMRGIKPPGAPSKMPVWEWDWSLSTRPDINTDAPASFMKVMDYESRVLPTEDELQYVVITEMTVRTHRITHHFGGDLLNTVNLDNDTP